ncbi:MAG: hypothetical protein HYT14_00205, partial [Candidatus Liptonbacteria bacterium]|nr:hypothetical protein [Candidatus Liptonbacteria bacterium]
MANANVKSVKNGKNGMERRRATLSDRGLRPKYKICVSGAAETGHCAQDALEKSE